LKYEIVLEQQAEKELRNLPVLVLNRIDKRLLAISEDPRSRQALKLKGKEGDGWRVKVGDYRILYVIDDARKQVIVYRIKHRREVYR
jgi:mRNA interferase RelE/StbE